MGTEDLETYVAECEQKITALQQRVRRLEERVEATINIATRAAIAEVMRRLQEALASDDG